MNLECVLETLNVVFERTQVFDRDRCDADRTLVFGGATFGGECVTEFAEIIQVFGRGAWRRLVRYGKAAQAMSDVGRVRNLAHLAVAWHVHARRFLSPDHLEYGGIDHLIEARYRFVAVLCEQHINHDLFARQAADVSGQNSVARASHGVLLVRIRMDPNERL